MNLPAYTYATFTCAECGEHTVEIHCNVYDATNLEPNEPLPACPCGSDNWDLTDEGW